MKIAAFIFALAPSLCAAAELAFPTTEGTTWNYEMVQERSSNSLDLTEPNEEEQFAVTYRLGGTEKIDNVELRRLEIYRGDALENVDLIAIEDRGIICPARMNGEGATTKLIPPQQMLALPLKTGTTWKFDGTIADTKVNQHYEIAGEEEVDVPAGKFRAWRIHCEQTLPANATIDRWFVPGTGFVKVETVLKGPSGVIAQKTSLKLKERPKVTAAPPRGETEPHSQEFTAGVSSEPNGNFKTEFKSDTPAIQARWHGHALPEKAEIRAAFIAESVADVSADYEVDEASTVAPKADSGGTFTLSKPETGWTPGNYRVEFFIGDKPAQTVKFKILK